MHILCDFDGTISTIDTTDLILAERAAPEWLAIEADWEVGAIDAATCMRRQVALIEGPLLAIDALVERVELRAGFLNFVAWADRKELPLTIVSDGIDYVIQRVLQRHNLMLPVVANRLVVERTTFALQQPHARDGCELGVCKCAIVDATVENRPVIFIGDGRSDFCVAGQTDLLFATGRLIAHCEREGIAFQPFDDFAQVRAALELIHASPTVLAA